MALRGSHELVFKAKERKMRKKQELEKFEERPVARSLDLQALIESFLEAQDIRPVSKRLYRKGVETFLSWLAAEGVQQPDRGEVLKFKDHLKGLQLSANTINAYLVGVSRFFAYLESSRLYPDITRNVKGVRQPKSHLRESLTEAQVWRVLESINTSSILGKRNYAMIMLMVNTGLRTVSIIEADLGDLRPMGDEAQLRYRNKGRDSKDEAALIVSHVLKPIMAYLKARGKARPDVPLFVSHGDNSAGGRLTTKTVRMVVKDLLRKNGIDDPRISAHSLRHTFATTALRNGAHLLNVSKALGHASVVTTQIYLHELDRMGDAAAERFVDYRPKDPAISTNLP